MSGALRALGVAALLLGLTVAGCGDEDPGAEGGQGATPRTSEAGGPREVALLSASAAGGQTGEPVLLDEAGVTELTAGLERGLPARIRDVVARTDVPEGQALVGAVVAVGCDEPTAVEVQDDSDGLRLIPVMVPRKTPVQCLVPVTSVGIVLVDADRAAGLD